MIITKIEPQKNNKDRHSVFLDGEFAFGLASHCFLQYPLKEGMVLSQQELEHIMEHVVFQDALQKALRFLSYRSRSEKEVYDKLVQSGFSEIAAAQVLEMLQENKLVDDSSFAAMYIEEKVTYNRYSPKKIEYELMKKGVSKKIIREQLAAAPLNEIENITLFLQNKWDPPDNTQKIIAALLRKGFTYDRIREAMQQYQQA